MDENNDHCNTKVLFRKNAIKFELTGLNTCRLPIIVKLNVLSGTNNDLCQARIILAGEGGGHKFWITLYHIVCFLIAQLIKSAVKSGFFSDFENLFRICVQKIEQ